MVYQVLILDDEPPIVQGLKSHVPWAQLGYEVVAGCTSPTVAIDLIRSRQVDVVLSDIRMPGMDGLTFCRTIKAEFPEIIVIFLSAYKDFEYAQKAVEIGAWRYLLKPTDHTKLYTAFEELHQVLDRRRATTDSSTQQDLQGRVEEIHQWVESHIHDASLEAAAGAIGLNPQYLSRRYKELTGKGFGEMVQRIRMEKAAHLLTKSRYKTYEISSIVGYSNPKNFSRRFRETYGCAPSEYRHSAGIPDETAP